MATLTYNPKINWTAGARRFIVEVAEAQGYGVPRGQVADLDLGLLYAPQPMADLLERGGWEQLDIPIDAEGILARVR